MLFSRIIYWFVLIGCIQSQETQETTYPREYMGIFFGEATFVEEGMQKKICTLSIRRPDKKLAYFVNPGPCETTQNLSFVDFLSGVQLQGSQVLEDFKFECTGKGQGHGWLNVGGAVNSNLSFPRGDQINSHVCTDFERAGDILYFTIGFFAGSPIEAECPPSAHSEPLIDPLTQYKAVLKAIGDKTRNITEDQFTCK